jgi:putative oxidoreductase
MRRFRDWRAHAPLAFAARLYLGLIFVTASWHKLMEPGSFALDIATYQILPLALVNPMAIILPWVEIVSGLMLIVGFRTRAAASLIAGMMLMFTVAIAIAVGKGLDMSCGCFASQGAAEDPISWGTIARDTGWLLLGVYVLFVDHKPWGIDRLWPRRIPAASAIINADKERP